MGREIRRVPPNWQHPQEEKFNHRRGCNVEQYKPLYDQSCEEAWSEWQSEFKAWVDGKQDQVIAEHSDWGYQKDQPYDSFCRWHGMPPDPETRRPQWPEGEATWYQVYETVSEGTPVTPPFETQDELIDYLVANGDFWDQSRREEGNCSMSCEPWSRQQAEKFVREVGWAPSLVMEGGEIKSGVEALCGEGENIGPPTKGGPNNETI